ncbi:hypothetical protein M9H77_16094 [Catharanthus roseus]|uniref:Uncharacterized protein n=1 Tax=Catharanthus roseus TaxID=4058 RepID=A0ACC0B183_CATRO|nr:hypothetical protein M9H77_16094 [Catharanthus roseus]
MKFPEYCQGLVVYSDSEHAYEKTLNISCTCKMFTEVGILCSHCLCVFNIHCVQVISDKNILKRWIKDIDLSWDSSVVGAAKKRREMLRKFLDLFSSSELNVNARECIEKGFRIIKDKIIAKVGPYYVDNSKNESRYSNIKDPIGRRAKGERNMRKKSIVEMKCNQAKGKRKSALTHASIIKTIFQLTMNNEALERGVNAPSSEFELSLGISNSSDGEPSSTLQTFINFI